MGKDLSGIPKATINNTGKYRFSQPTFPVLYLGDLNFSPLCFLPQQHIVLKFSRHFPGIFQPRKVRAHRTSHQNILLKVHGKSIAFEHFLQNPLKAYRLPTDGQNPLCHLIHFIPVIVDKFLHISRGICMGGNEHNRFHPLHLIQRFQICAHVINEGNCIFVQRLPAADTVRKEHHIVRHTEPDHVKEMPRQGYHPISANLSKKCLKNML